MIVTEYRSKTGFFQNIQKDMMNTIQTLSSHFKGRSYVRILVLVLFISFWVYIHTFPFPLIKEAYMTLFNYDIALLKLLSPVIYLLPILILFYFTFRHSLALLLNRMSILHFVLYVLFFTGLQFILSFTLLIFYGMLGLNWASNPATTKLMMFDLIYTLPIQLIAEQLFFMSFLLFSLVTINKIITSNVLAFLAPVLFSSLIFGLAHLSTYNYNVLHCVILIGIPACIQGVCFLITKNLFVGYLVHLIFDVVIFGIILYST
ncbi:CPBP family intramembrane metalloprotease [Bacillus altitudinis]|nr:CPBP family intramembrane metalloprotease [Bacillus altitudinis]